MYGTEYEISGFNPFSKRNLYDNFQPPNAIRTLSNFHTNDFQSSAIDFGHY
jgi:hypothetical protein